MVSKSFNLHNGRRGSALAVRIISYGDCSKIVRISTDGTLEVSLKVAKGEEEANSALIQYLSRILNASKDNLEIIAGQTGRDKLVSVFDIDPSVVQEKLTSEKSKDLA